MNLFAIIFLAGIVTALQFNQLGISSIVSTSHFLFGFGAVICAAWTFIKWLRLPILAFLAGALLVQITQYSVISRQLEPAQSNIVLTLVGEVISIPKQQSARTRFIFLVDKSLSSELPIKARRLSLTWYGSSAKVLRAGQQWRLRVKLAPMKSITNPGSFDFSGWLFQQRIHATGFVTTSKTNQLLAQQWSVNSMRQSLATYLANEADDARHVGLMRGLLVGVRDQIDSTTWDVLRATGTSHLLAISGLHIGMLAFWGYLFGFCLWSLLFRLCEYTRKQKTPEARLLGVWQINRSDCAMVFSAIAATGYAALAGFTLPTQRALIMLAVVLLLRLTRRHTQTYLPIALALVLVLLLDALSPLSAGFWLSFSAVLILLSCGSKQPAGQQGWLGALQAAIKTHLIMGVVMFPITAILFGQGSLVAPLANFFAIPWVSFLIVPALMLWLILTPVSSALAYWALAWTELALEVLLSALSWLQQNIHAEIILGRVGALEFGSLLLAAVILILPHVRHQRWLALPLLVPFVWAQVAPRADQLRITVLDVGTGVSVVLQQAGQTVVYGTGAPSGRRGNRASSALLSFLRAEGVNRIDHLILPHRETLQAVPALAEEVAVNSVVVPAGAGSNTSLRGVVRCDSGLRWSAAGSKFSTERVSVAGGDMHACVLRVQHGINNIVFGGRLDASTLQDTFFDPSLSEPLRDSRFVLQLLVIQPTIEGASAQRVAAVPAEQLVLSVGTQPEREFAHEVVQMRYKLAGAKTYDTDQSGALEFQFSRSAQLGPVKRYRQLLKRVWHTGV